MVEIEEIKAGDFVRIRGLRGPYSGWYKVELVDFDASVDLFPVVMVQTGPLTDSLASFPPSSIEAHTPKGTSYD